MGQGSVSRSGFERNAFLKGGIGDATPNIKPTLRCRDVAATPPFILTWRIDFMCLIQKSRTEELGE
jgi:hypothetical protein